MFKNSPSICYLFFATDDVTVMSVNTYMLTWELALRSVLDQISTRKSEISSKAIA